MLIVWVADIRHVPFVENMVSIYRSLDATVCANLFQQRSSGELLYFLVDKCFQSKKKK